MPNYDSDARLDERMRAYAFGAQRVDLTETEVREWARSWPCFGEPRALWFEFDREGDLVDAADTEGLDPTGVLALSHDAQAGKVGTSTRRGAAPDPKSPAGILLREHDTARQAYDYARRKAAFCTNVEMAREYDEAARVIAAHFGIADDAPEALGTFTVRGQRWTPGGR